MARLARVGRCTAGPSPWDDRLPGPFFALTRASEGVGRGRDTGERSHRQVHRTSFAASCRCRTGRARRGDTRSVQSRGRCWHQYQWAVRCAHARRRPFNPARQSQMRRTAAGSQGNAPFPARSACLPGRCGRAGRRLISSGIYAARCHRGCSSSAAAPPAVASNKPTPTAAATRPVPHDRRGGLSSRVFPKNALAAPAFAARR